MIALKHYIIKSQKFKIFLDKIINLLEKIDFTNESYSISLFLY